MNLAKASFELAQWRREDNWAMRVQSFPHCEDGARPLFVWLRDNSGPGSPIGLVMGATATFAEAMAIPKGLVRLRLGAIRHELHDLMWAVVKA
jgi:hypothetical protein